MNEVSRRFGQTLFPVFAISLQIIDGLFLVADFKLAKLNRQTSAIILATKASRS